MKNRRAFLIASGAVGVAAALARRAEGVEAATAPAARRPSEAARATAATMRRFDPELTAGDLESIARGIDDATAAAKALRTKREPLRNGDGPVTTFVVPFA